MSWTHTNASHRAAADSDATAIARNMLDAVSYLIRVASGAGLNGVARKLTLVRVDLEEAAERKAGKHEHPEHSDGRNSH